MDPRTLECSLNTHVCDPKHQTKEIYTEAEISMEKNNYLNKICIFVETLCKTVTKKTECLSVSINDFNTSRINIFSFPLRLVKILWSSITSHV